MHENGNVRTLANAYPVENGGRAAGSGFSLVLSYNGSIYAYARSGSWRQWYIFASGGWLQVAGDRRGSTSRLDQPIPSSLFGVQTHGNWPTVPFGVLGKGSDTAWPYIESSRGNRNWSPPRKRTACR